MRYTTTTTMDDPNSSSHQTAACYQGRKPQQEAFHNSSSNNNSYSTYNSSYSSISSCTSSDDLHATTFVTAATEDDLIRQFNDALQLGATCHVSVEPSVAQFLLELCDRDVPSAVAFYKAQQDQEANNGRGSSPSSSSSITSSRSLHASSSTSALASRRHNLRRVTAQSCRNVTTRPSVARHLKPRRHRSFDDQQPGAQANFKTFHGARKVKSVDVAEAPSISAPAFYRSNHSRYPTPRNGLIPRSKLAPSCGYLGRAKSERHFFHNDRAGPTKTTATSTSKASPSPSLRTMRRHVHQNPPPSYGSRRESSLHSSWKDIDYDGSCAATTRPPTAMAPSRASSTRSLGRNWSGQEPEKWDPSAKAA